MRCLDKRESDRGKEKKDRVREQNKLLLLNRRRKSHLKNRYKWNERAKNGRDRHTERKQ